MPESKRNLYLAFFLLFLLGGCAAIPDMATQSGNVELGKSYGIDPGLVIPMKKNVTIADIKIPETWGSWDRDIEMSINDVHIDTDDGQSLKGVVSPSTTLTLAHGSYASLSLHFVDVPVKYRMAENPMRLVPLNIPYEVVVTYTAKAELAGVAIPFWSSDGVLYRKTLYLPAEEVMLK